MSQTDPKLDELLDTWRVAVDSYSDDTRSRSAIQSYLRTAVEQETEKAFRAGAEWATPGRLLPASVLKAAREYARSTTQPTETGATK